ncbi:MAG: glycosyltransferase family 4 protein [Gammaproteobacteria bacterium]|jgi:glycosyltransferase involved in cell wall biosynthesis
MKILILGTVPNDLLNFRADLIKDIIKKNHEVIISSSSLDPNSTIHMNNLGVAYEAIFLNRHGLKIGGDIKTLIDLLKIFKKQKPHLVLAHGIKLVIWGGISASIRNIPFFALITGLGFAFQGKSLKRRLLTKLVSFLYKIALKKSKAVIFQNKDNRDLFIKKGIVPRSKTHIVNGSGVDIKKYSYTKQPDNDVSFLLVSRLLGEKGLREYAAAAKIVKAKFHNIKFDLVGAEDASLDAIPLEEVISWSNYVNYNGSTLDVRPYIKKCHVYVLPSYHEGLPRSTLEAMSMGRPILTTNATGCKETVDEGINGFMVPIGSIKKLAEKMIWFIENKDKIQTMGEQSRIIVESRFDVRRVNEDMLKILGI